MNETDDKKKAEAGLDFRDSLVLAGLAFLAVGFWIVWRPAAFIVPGAIMTAIAVFGVRGK